MPRIFAVAAVPLALAACNSQPSIKAENASAAEVAAAVKDAAKLEPGKWRNSVTLISADAPGLPPAMGGSMTQQMKAMSERTQEMCITPEQANRPPSEMMGGAGNNCTYETFEMAGGKMNAAMVCKGPQGGAMRMTTSGSFASTGYDLTSEMKMPMPMGGAGAEMTIRTRVEGKRIGECDGRAG